MSTLAALLAKHTGGKTKREEYFNKEGETHSAIVPESDWLQRGKRARVAHEVAQRIVAGAGRYVVDPPEAPQTIPSWRSSLRARAPYGVIAEDDVETTTTTTTITTTKPVPAVVAAPIENYASGNFKRMLLSTMVKMVNDVLLSETQNADDDAEFRSEMRNSVENDWAHDGDTEAVVHPLIPLLRQARVPNAVHLDSVNNGAPIALVPFQQKERKRVDLEIVLKAHEDSYLRPPRRLRRRNSSEDDDDDEENGPMERACSRRNRCVGLHMLPLIFDWPVEVKGFILAEFLLPSEERARDGCARNDDEDSDEEEEEDEESDVPKKRGNGGKNVTKRPGRGLCLLCLRQYVSMMWEHSKPRDIHAAHAIQPYRNVVNRAGEYSDRATLMLRTDKFYGIFDPFIEFSLNRYCYRDGRLKQRDECVQYFRNAPGALEWKPIPSFNFELSRFVKRNDDEDDDEGAERSGRPDDEKKRDDDEDERFLKRLIDGDSDSDDDDEEEEEEEKETKKKKSSTKRNRIDTKTLHRMEIERRRCAKQEYMRTTPDEAGEVTDASIDPIRGVPKWVPRWINKPNLVFEESDSNSRAKARRAFDARQSAEYEVEMELAKISLHLRRRRFREKDDVAAAAEGKMERREEEEDELDETTRRGLELLRPERFAFTLRNLTDYGFELQQSSLCDRFETVQRNVRRKGAPILTVHELLYRAIPYERLQSRFALRCRMANVIMPPDTTHFISMVLRASLGGFYPHAEYSVCLSKRFWLMETFGFHRDETVSKFPSMFPNVTLLAVREYITFLVDLNPTFADAMRACHGAIWTRFVEFVRAQADRVRRIWGQWNSELSMVDVEKEIEFKGVQFSALPKWIWASLYTHFKRNPAVKVHPKLDKSQIKLFDTRFVYELGPIVGNEEWTRSSDDDDEEEEEEENSEEEEEEEKETFESETVANALGIAEKSWYGVLNPKNQTLERRRIERVLRRAARDGGYSSEACELILRRYDVIANVDRRRRLGKPNPPGWEIRWPPLPPNRKKSRSRSRSRFSLKSSTNAKPIEKQSPDEVMNAFLSVCEVQDDDDSELEEGEEEDDEEEEEEEDDDDEESTRPSRKKGGGGGKRRNRTPRRKKVDKRRRRRRGDRTPESIEAERAVRAARARRREEDARRVAEVFTPHQREILHEAYLICMLVYESSLVRLIRAPHHWYAGDRFKYSNDVVQCCPKCRTIKGIDRDKKFRYDKDVNRCFCFNKKPNQRPSQVTSMCDNEICKRTECVPIELNGNVVEFFGRCLTLCRFCEMPCFVTTANRCMNEVACSGCVANEYAEKIACEKCGVEQKRGSKRNWLRIRVFNDPNERNEVWFCYNERIPWIHQHAIWSYPALARALGHSQGGVLLEERDLMRPSAESLRRIRGDDDEDSSDSDDDDDDEVKVEEVKEKEKVKIEEEVEEEEEEDEDAIARRRE